jgi:hypothetical protein
MNESPYIFFESADRAVAQTAGNIESYDGVLSANASRRSYIDIEPNISVRTEFLKDDYYRFRRNEESGGDIQRIIKMCSSAYDKVGIIKNIIDLMGNFASQGISIHHTNKSIEAFYRKWWEKVDGAERSERFLNMFYRLGNVIVYVRNGKITKKIERSMSKASEIEIKQPEVIRKELPFKYDFLNPLSLIAKGNYKGSFSGIPNYRMKISLELKNAYSKKEDASLLENLPEQLRKAVISGKDYIDLEPEKIKAFFYKKDDWQVWAKPMIHAILDDIIMLEKMKLADMSALDGAISNIRLWRLGDLEHKILPTKSSIDRLRNILASNVGGGTMDLVWGPEIDFKESTTQIYKFLGNEKYQPVLSSIYGGLGIPATLTGAIGQSGGFTNNFISLKTLIEQLEYGRDTLKKFWNEQIELVQRVMGFPEPATLHFENMILSDETSEKNLLISLVDRDIISYETVRERLGENNKLESSRIKSEYKQRDKGNYPPKADPFHNGNTESEYTKIALQKGQLSIKDVTDIEPSNPGILQQPGQTNEKKPANPNGRPEFSKDATKRKQKVVNPRSKAFALNLVYATESLKKIADVLHPALLAYYKKKNLRELSKAEFDELESIKFRALSNLEPNTEISPEYISSLLLQKPNKSVLALYKEYYSDFLKDSSSPPSIDESRNMQCIAYAVCFSSDFINSVDFI